MATITTRGRTVLMQWMRGTSMPSALAMVLVTDTPTAATKVQSELTEVANGNGYTTGGISVSLNSTDFDSFAEDDTADETEIQIKNLVWTASGGNIPASGSGPLFAVLVDDAVDPNVIAYFSFDTAQTVLSGNSLTLIDFRLILGGVLTTIPNTEVDYGQATVANNDGSWIEAIASTSGKGTHLLLQVRSGILASAGPATLGIDVGTGAAASEVAILENVLAQRSVSSGVYTTIQATVPFEVASGTRIAVRPTGGSGVGDSGSATVEVTLLGRS